MTGKYEEVTFAKARKTAYIVGGVLIAIAAFLGYRGRTSTPAVLAAIALVLLVIGTVAPPLAIAFHRMWMWIAFKLGWVNSRILLTLVYVILVVPYKLVSRLSGRDPLSVRQPRAESYWQPRKVTKQTRERFERLF